LKTLLERAKGSPLDIFASYADPASAMALLTPHTKQIKHLGFVYDQWDDIQRFSAANPGPFPLLRTLAINAAKEIDEEDADEMTPSSLPLFSNAPNLTEFRLHSERSPSISYFALLRHFVFLGHFVFPNLTVFELSVASVKKFHVSQLLDFLEASPMLRTVRVRITASISFGGVPEGRLVILPSFETLYLVTSDCESHYVIAAHISCTSAKHTSLIHEKFVDENRLTVLESFPDPDWWDRIVRQYTKSPVEEVTLKIKIGPDPIIACCSLTFWSPDAVVIRLGFKLAENYEKEGSARLHIRSSDLYPELFSSASSIIQEDPLSVNIKRLNIYNNFLVLGSDQIPGIADEVRSLFQSVGPLEELTMYCCDLRPYLTPPKSRGVRKPIVFPPVRELTISHPSYPRREECMAAIVGLVKSQHVQGVPFERVTIRMEEPPAAMVERLSPWVGAAYCYNERYVAIGDDDPSPI